MFGKNIPVRDIEVFDIQRRVTANKTMEAWDEVPHAGVVVDLDVSRVLDLIEELKREPALEGVRLTVHGLMLKLLAEAILASPDLNAHVEYSKRTCIGKITRFDDVNMAMTVLLDDGRMITPVLKQVDKKTLREVCLGMMDLQRRVANTNVDFLLMTTGRIDSYQKLRNLRFGILPRLYANLFGKNRLDVPSKRTLREYERIPETDRLVPEDLFCGTVMVSNVGSALRGADLHVGLLEIIPPQAAVIALGPIRKRPVAITENGADTVAVRPVLSVSLYFDHRAIDLKHILGFLHKLPELAENPRSLALY